MTIKINHELGVIARDKITGFKGTITAVGIYLTGCHQYCLQPEVKEDGDYVKGNWFDDDRIEEVEEAKVKIDNTDPDGGPRESYPGRA